MQKTHTTRWGIVTLAVFAGMIGAAHVGKLPPALPEIRGDLGMSLVAGGWTVSLFNVTGMTIALIAGTFADRIGHWRFAMIGLGCLGLGSALGSSAAAAGLLMATRLLEGFGFIAVAVSAPAVIAGATASHQRRLAFGIWGAYMPAGSALMMVLSPLVLAAAGWRILWLVAAAVTALGLAVMWNRRHQAPKSAGGGQSLLGNVQATARCPESWLLALCFGLYTIPWLSLVVWLPSFLIETRGVATEAAAALTALVVAMNVPGNLLAGWYLHRGVSHWVLIAVAALVMGLSAVVIFTGILPDALRYFACLVFSLVGGMLPTSALSGAQAFAPSPSQVGTMSGLIMQGSNTGQVIGPPLLAAVVQATGTWEASLSVMVAACALAIVAAFGLRRFERRRLAATESAPAD